MRFDSQGNLYLYKPGAGMSGAPRRVIEFGSNEVVYTDEGDSGKLVQKKSVMGCETCRDQKCIISFQLRMYLLQIGM